jgi:hypothetical protein
MLDLIHAYALVGRCLTHSVWFAFCISFKAAVEEYTKAVAAMKLASDKVTRDLAQCALIEASLKAKKWDTTKMQEYLKAESDHVAKNKDELFEKWVLLKQVSLDTMTDAELKSKAEEASLLTKAVLESFKKFAKETLSEFRA